MSGGSWEREGWGWASFACPVLLECQKEVDSYKRLVIMTDKKKHAQVNIMRYLRRSLQALAT